MPFKLCIIGAGSVGFTRKLCSDILKVPEFEGIEIALTDISQANLDMIAQILRKMIEVSGLKTKVTATTDRIFDDLCNLVQKRLKQRFEAQLQQLKAV